MNLNLTKKNQAGIGHIAEVALMCIVGLLIGTYVAGQFDKIAGLLVADLESAESNIFSASNGSYSNTAESTTSSTSNGNVN